MFILRANLVGTPLTKPAFDEFECNRIIKLGENFDSVPGSIDGQDYNPEKRRSKVKWFHPTNDTMWVYDRVANMVDEVNAKWFNYELTTISTLQLSNYSERESGFYKSHTDTQVEPTAVVRKLSFVVQLTDPTTYEGGQLKVYENLENFSVMNPAQGTASFFPSYKIHEVSPVTKGERYTLVGWVYGPAFK